MNRPLPFPLPAEELPQGIRRFGDPNAPTPARTMAARGLVPVRGNDLVTLLVQLANDPDPAISSAADESLSGIPEGVLLSACESPTLHPSVLDDLSRRFGDGPEVRHRLVQNHGTSDATIKDIAIRCDEATTELIATNQQRLLAAPAIIEALYKNRNTRMSTADRLIELAARHGVELTGIPAFQAHVEAIRGQLIPEATDEPLPGDMLFAEALAHDDEDEEAVELDLVDGSEAVKDRFKPLQIRIRDMSISEKIRMTVVGDAAARAILVRDVNKIVSHAAISSPRVSITEATNFAHSKEVSDDILRYVGNKREWVRSYEVKRALLHNPKCPIGIALKFVSHMRDNDLKALARSRNVPASIKQAARQRLDKKSRKT